MPFDNRSFRNWPRVRIPTLAPVCIAEYICATLSSRIKLRIADVPIMTSCAATGPLLGFFNKVYEITDCSDSYNIDLTISFSATGTTSIALSIVFATEVVCRVTKTKWPVSAAVNASRIISKSRSSPIRMMSGSARSPERNSSLKPCVSLWT